MALTPLLLTAMQGLLNNDSFDINKEFKDLLDEYASLPIVTAYRELNGGNYYYDPQAGLTFPDTGSTYNIRTEINNMFSDVPFITDTYNNSSCGESAQYFTEYLLDWSYIILGTHRNQNHTNSDAKFVQTLQILMGYVEQINEAINSAVNGIDVGKSSFTSMNDIATGNLTAITTSTTLFGDELLNTGKLLDFSKLKFYGTPQGLLLALIRTNAIGMLINEFNEAGLDAAEIANDVIDLEIQMEPAIQQKIYTLFTTITDKKLADIMLIMDVNINGILTLADLLDTYKIFPNSKNTLLTIENGKTVPLNKASTRYNVLENIIPENIAKYNILFRNSLFQIKAISETKVKDLAKQFKAIESTNGLDVINDFEKPLPDSTVSTPGIDIPEGTVVNASSPLNVSFTSSVGDPGILNHLAIGQGTNGLIYVTDGVGTPCGTTHIETLTQLIKYHTDIDNILEQNIINKLTEIHTISWQADVDYRANNDEPQRNDYPTENDWLADWIPWNNTRITYIQNAINPLLNDLTNLINQLPPEPEVAREAFNASLTQVQVEQNVLTEAIDWLADIPDQTEKKKSGGLCAALWNMLTNPANKKTILGFISTLHSYAEKTDLHNIAEVLEKLSKSNQGGQAIIAAMREGRNLKKLDETGVKTDTRVSGLQKNPLPGEITPAQT